MKTELSVLPVLELCQEHGFVLTGLSQVCVPKQGWRTNILFDGANHKDYDWVTHTIQRWAQKYPQAKLIYCFSVVLPDGATDFVEHTHDSLLVPVVEVEPLPRRDHTPRPSMGDADTDASASCLMVLSRTPIPSFTYFR